MCVAFVFTMLALNMYTFFGLDKTPALSPFVEEKNDNVLEKKKINRGGEGVHTRHPCPRIYCMYIFFGGGKIKASLSFFYVFL